MKNKSFVCIIFFTPIIIFLGIELFININIKEMDYTNNISKVKNGNVKCLILGDSHPEHAFLNELNECVNLSLGGTTIPMHRDLLESVLLKNDLKTVILSLDPHNFSNYRLRNYTPMFVNITSSYRPFISIIPVQEELKNYIKSLYKRKNNDNHQNPISWYNLSLKEKQKKIEKRFENHLDIPNDFSKTSYARTVKNLVNKLNKLSIKVILVRTPVVEDYNIPIMKRIGISKWNDFIYELESIGAKYVDYKKIDFDYKNEKYFKDQDHLNRLGAGVFSKNFLGIISND